MAHASPSHERMLTFRVDDQSFAVGAGHVREIARMPRISRVPHAPPMLLGLANLRGSIIPVVSAALLLDRPASVPTRLIVIDAGELVGLAVDEASQVLQAAQIGPSQAVDIADLIARNVPARVERQSRGMGSGSLRDEDAALTETVGLVAFAVGKQEFALPLPAIEEVLPLPANIALMPHADAVVVGSTAFRGAVLPLLSLAVLLGLPRSATTARASVLVTRIGKHRVGLLVDEMRSVLRVPETMIDPVPQALTRGQSEARILAICRLDDGKRLVSVLAAEHLLRDDITARLMQSASAEQDEMVQDQAQSAKEQFLIFRIGAEEFAIPIGSVEEVAALPAKLTRLPMAPEFVMGVMNLRGQVIPIIDQSLRFGASASPAGRRRVIVVRTGDLQAGFIVDGVSDVVAIDIDAIQAAPYLGSDETRAFERVASLDDRDRLVLIVSPRELLDRAEQELLRGLGRKGAKTRS